MATESYKITQALKYSENSNQASIKFTKAQELIDTLNYFIDGKLLDNIEHFISDIQSINKDTCDSI